MVSVISTSCLNSRLGVSQPPISCASKVFEGSRVQSPYCHGTGTSNLNVEFHTKVLNSIQSRCGKSARGCVTMMPVGTMKVPYKHPGERNSQWIDLTNALYRERVILITQHIDEEFSNQLLCSLLYLDSIDDSRKLHFFINGPGGDLNPSLALYDTMQSLKTPVCTHLIGFAYNMAVFLLAAGDKGHRSAMPLTMIGLEPPAGGARGQADDIQNETQQLLKIRDYLYKELAEKTGQPVEKIHKDLARTMYLTAQEALEYGLIDRISKSYSTKQDAPIKDATAGLG